MLIPTPAPGRTRQGMWGGMWGWMSRRAQRCRRGSRRYTCPFVEKFSIEIETYYRQDAGQQPNIFNLSAAEKRQRILGAYGQPAVLGRTRCLRHSHTELPGWVRGRAKVPEGLRFPAGCGAWCLHRVWLCSLCWILWLGGGLG